MTSFNQYLEPGGSPRGRGLPAVCQSLNFLKQPNVETETK